MPVRLELLLNRLSIYFKKRTLHIELMVLKGFEFLSRRKEAHVSREPEVSSGSGGYGARKN